MNCVMCNKEINTDCERYSVGESLGEYWCEKCAEVEGREKLGEILQQDIIQAIEDGFDGHKVKRENILNDVKWLIYTVQKQEREIKLLDGAVEEDDATKTRLLEIIERYEKALKRIAVTTMSMGFTSPSDMANGLRKLAREALESSHNQN